VSGDVRQPQSDHRRARDAVLVAEASLRSGSIGTGRLARKAGRSLAVFAGTAGCGTLIAEGAFALPEPGLGVDDPVAAHARVRGWLRGKPEQIASCWPAELAWLRDALLAGPSTGVALEQLADPSHAIVALCEAELLGLVCEVTPSRWKVVVE
jgi:predicted Rossmann fold nucleotide-binding protein DprA/Smf involved in DNA uptake